MQIGGEGIENLLMKMASKTKTHTHKFMSLYLKMD
jgi:hypothetical protein